MTHLQPNLAFHPDIICILSDALDDAWRHLQGGAHLNGDGDAARAVLAKHIIAMAQQGELDRQRLVEGALARLKL
jgi:hypothetical protein